jgi:hypothetical protein
LSGLYLYRLLHANLEKILQHLGCSRSGADSQLTAGKNERAFEVLSLPPMAGCPILRVLCEGWESQISPLKRSGACDFIDPNGPQSRASDLKNKSPPARPFFDEQAAISIY